MTDWNEFLAAVYMLNAADDIMLAINFWTVLSLLIPKLVVETFLEFG